MTSTPPPSYPQTSIAIDDEIDLIELFRPLWHHKTKIIIAVIIATGIALFISLLSAPLYKSRTSFFLRTPQSQSNALSGYASLLGISTGGSSNVSNHIQNILDSTTIQHSVAEKLTPYYQHEINTAIQKKQLENNALFIRNFIIAKSKLSKRFNYEINPNSLFEMTFVSTDPKLSQTVLSIYLAEILDYNRNLELSAERNIITVIDAPSLPLGPFKPNIKLNMVLGAVLGFLGSCVAILIKAALTSNKPST